MPQKPVNLDTKPIPVGCFAPCMTEEKLVEYQAIADSLTDQMGEVRDAMRECLAAVKLWWSLPESNGSKKDQSLEIKHQGKDTLVKIVTLTNDLKEQLWDAVPWPYEVRSMQNLFDETFKDRSAHSKELVDACYHLLWFVRELTLDREPLTQDKLGV